MDNRDPAAAPNIFKNRNKAALAIPGGILAGYLVGIPLSFVTTSSNSRPWEPFDMVISGSLWAFVITIFTVLIAFLMQRYVSLYRTGTRVPSQVISEKPLPAGRAVVVQFVLPNGETRFSYVPQSQLPVGAATSTIVAQSGNLVLNQNDPLGYARGSALTQAQVQQILSGGVGS